MWKNAKTIQRPISHTNPFDDRIELNMSLSELCKQCSGRLRCSLQPEGPTPEQIQIKVTNLSVSISCSQGFN